MSQGGHRSTSIALKNYNAGEDDTSCVEVSDPSEYVFPMPAPGYPVNGRIPASLPGNGRPLTRQLFYLNLRGPDTLISFDSSWVVHMVEVMRIWWKMPVNVAAEPGHSQLPVPLATPVRRPLDDTLSLVVEQTNWKSSSEGGVNLEKNIRLNYPFPGHVPTADPATEIGSTGFYHQLLLQFPLKYSNPAPFQADQTTAPLDVNAANNFVDVYNTTRFQRYFSPPLQMQNWRFQLLDINGRVYTAGDPLQPQWYDPMWYGGNVINFPVIGGDTHYPVIIRVEMAVYCST